MTFPSVSCLAILLLSTRKPCCRRKVLRDAGHLYRKLAPKPQAEAAEPRPRGIREGGLATKMSNYTPTKKSTAKRPQIGCLPYFHTWCGPSANLECRSEICCTRLAGNTGHIKSPFWHYRPTLSGYIFGTEAYIDNRKKHDKQQYLIHMF